METRVTGSRLCGAVRFEFETRSAVPWAIVGADTPGREKGRCGP